VSVLPEAHTEFHLSMFGIVGFIPTASMYVCMHVCMYVCIMYVCTYVCVCSVSMLSVLGKGLRWTDPPTKVCTNRRTSTPKWWHRERRLSS